MSDSSMLLARRRTLLIATGLLALIIAAALLVHSHHQMQSLEDRHVDLIGQSLSRQLAQGSLPLVLSQDWVSLNYSLQQAREDVHVAGARIQDTQGKVLAQVGQNSDYSFNQALSSGEQSLGELSLFIDRQSLAQSLVKQRNSVPAAILLGLASLLLGFWLALRWLDRGPSSSAGRRAFGSDNFNAHNSNAKNFNAYGQDAEKPNSAEAYTEKHGESSINSEFKFRPDPALLDEIQGDWQQSSDDEEEQETDLLAEPLHTETPTADHSDTGVQHDTNAESSQGEDTFQDPVFSDRGFPDSGLQDRAFHDRGFHDRGFQDSTFHSSDLPRSSAPQSSHQEADFAPMDDVYPARDISSRSVEAGTADTETGGAKDADEQAVTLGQYLLYIDHRSAGHHLEDEKAALLPHYLQFFQLASQLYNGEQREDTQGNWYALFTWDTSMSDAQVPAGVSALCAAQLFKSLYRQFNQSRIQSLQPVLNLKMALLGGDNELTLALHAHQLTAMLESNELISHQAVFEQPELFQRLLQEGDYSRQDQDTYLIHQLAAGFQHLIDRQATHFLQQKDAQQD